MKIVPPTETVTGHDEQPMAPAPSDEIVTENQAGPAGDAKRGKRGFLWTEEHERLLAEAVRTRKPPSTNAKIKEIAARFDWPYHVVDYRMRQLHKKGENAPPVSEEPVLQEQTLTETEPVTSPLTIDVSPGPAPLTRSTEQVLQEPHQDEAQSVTSPLTDDVSPARLAPGPYLWDVKIDGNLQRWQLDAPYGNFPFASPGTPFVYREQAYVIQRVSHSVISVTPAVHAPRPAVMELAQV